LKTSNWSLEPQIEPNGMVSVKRRDSAETQSPEPPLAL
jgi:hypothetical protein